MFKCLASRVVRSRQRLYDHVLHRECWQKTWRIVVIHQIHQSFLPAKVLFYMVYGISAISTTALMSTKNGCFTSSKFLTTNFNFVVAFHFRKFIFPKKYFAQLFFRIMWLPQHANDNGSLCCNSPFPAAITRAALTTPLASLNDWMYNLKLFVNLSLKVNGLPLFFSSNTSIGSIWLVCWWFSVVLAIRDFLQLFMVLHFSDRYCGLKYIIATVVPC